MSLFRIDKIIVEKTKFQWKIFGYIMILYCLIFSGIILLVDNLELTKKRIYTEPKIPIILIHSDDYILTREDVRYYAVQYLEKSRKRWGKRNIKWFIDILSTGYKEFNIHPKIVLSIIKIESNFTPKITSKPNKNKTVDYGISQINSKNWKRLQRKSLSILDKYKIWYSKKGNKHDVAINTMNCFVYLDSARTSLKKKGKFNLKKWIQSYNVGLSGCLSKQERYKKLRKIYWCKFVLAYSIDSRDT